MPDNPRILAIGLNPAWQKTLEFPDFQVGQVNRATSLGQGVGGKACHFTNAVQRLAPGSVRVVHFLGGPAGRLVEEYFAARGVAQIIQPIGEETRTCTTILDRATDTMTELIEPSPEIPESRVQALLERVLDELPGTHGIGICGTFPPGVTPEFYGQIAAKKPREAVLLVDCYKGVEAVLEAGGVTILKINRQELCTLADTDTHEAAARTLMARYAVPWIGMTDGGNDAWLYGQRERHRYELPPLEDLRNPLGAGDTNSGVTVLNAARGMAMPEAFAWGLAAASASCREVEPARFTEESMNEAFAAINHHTEAWEIDHG